MEDPNSSRRIGILALVMVVLLVAAFTLRVTQPFGTSLSGRLAVGLFVVAITGAVACAFYVATHSEG